MAICTRDHRYDPAFAGLPHDQGGDGRHHCAGCAYDAGFEAGLVLRERVNIDLAHLDQSQAGDVRHRSPHAAWALGYVAGVAKHYSVAPPTKFPT